MRVLLRQLKARSRSVSATYADQPLNRPSIRIGRGTDQDICLPNLRVALTHAEIVTGNDRRLRINAVGAAGVRHNGALVQGALLSLGDVIEIGGHRLEVRKADGFDFMLVVEELPATRGRETLDALMARSCMSLEAAGLSTRPWSWLLFLGISFIFLIVSLSGVLLPTLQSTLRHVAVLPSDQLWLSGPVSRSHSGFASRCETCHTTPFVPTRDAACLDCHQDLPHHVEQPVLDAGAMAGDGSRCGYCHHEHTGTLTLLPDDERLCGDCHRDIAQRHAESDLGNVDGFADGHPQFRASLTRFEAGVPSVVRKSMDDPTALIETSNLHFPHDVHLRRITGHDPAGRAVEGGIRSPERGVVELDCASCHRPEPGGARMTPVTFEAHCRECHRLVIPGDEFREVPHGDLSRALATLEDYFSGWALRGGYPNLMAPDVVLERRRPGHELSDEERRVALEWARRMAGHAAGEMLEYTTCGVCHEAERSTGADALGGWKMQPVAVNTTWLPRHRFSHAGHATMDCKACHLAERSTQSSDVLLVGENGKWGIAACRECHASEHAPRDRVSSTCISCHGFHIATHARLQP